MGVTPSTADDDVVDAFARRHFGNLESLGDGCGELADDIRAWMVEHDVVFADQPIPFVMAPHCLDEPTMARVQHVVEVLTRILDRFCTAFRTDAGLRLALDLPPAEADLIRIEPTLDDPLQLCRLDAFLMPDGGLQFLEFNAESPAGIGYTDVMFDGLYRHFDALHDADGELVVTYERITEQLIRTVRDVEARWREWTTGPDGPGRDLGIPRSCDRPRALLVDTADSPSVPEFGIICRALEQAGFDASWSSLDDLTLIDGRLHAVDGEPIDVVYRRALVEDVLDPFASPGASALIAAVRTGSVAMFNPFPARVANNKKLLALIGAPEFAHLLVDDEERRIVRDCIPWTRILAPGDSTLPDGTTGNLADYVSRNRSSLVLKPASDYGGHNVHLGLNTPQHQWDAIDQAQAGTGDWIVQQYLDVPVGSFPAIENGRLVVRERFFNINPFSIGGRYAGMITRISTEPVINVSAGGGLLPCVCVEPAS
jgi:uncharacterized circularly permuted ATP-grasp superfamily protein